MTIVLYMLSHSHRGRNFKEVRIAKERYYYTKRDTQMHLMIWSALFRFRWAVDIYLTLVVL
jgi:hypothetical protein